jgi:hypothetical protein
MNLFKSVSNLLLKGAVIGGSYVVAKKAAAKVISSKYFRRFKTGTKKVLHYVALALIMLILILLGFAIINGAFKAFEKKDLQREKKAVEAGNYSTSKGLPKNVRKGASSALATETDDVEKRIIALETAYLAKQPKAVARKWGKGKKGGINIKNRKKLKALKEQIGERYGYDSNQKIGRELRMAA